MIFKSAEYALLKEYLYRQLINNIQHTRKTFLYDNQRKENYLSCNSQKRKEPQTEFSTVLFILEKVNIPYLSAGITFLFFL